MQTKLYFLGDSQVYVNHEGKIKVRGNRGGRGRVRVKPGVEGDHQDQGEEQLPYAEMDMNAANELQLYQQY